MWVSACFVQNKWILYRSPISKILWFTHVSVTKSWIFFIFILTNQYICVIFFPATKCCCSIPKWEIDTNESKAKQSLKRKSSIPIWETDSLPYRLSNIFYQPLIPPKKLQGSHVNRASPEFFHKRKKGRPRLGAGFAIRFCCCRLSLDLKKPEALWVFTSQTRIVQ